MSVIGRTAPWLASAASGASQYATWNPLDKGAACTLSNGDLSATGNETNGTARATIGRSSGIWVAEFSSPGGRFPICGLGTASATLADFPGADANGWGFYGLTAKKITNGVQTAYGSVWNNTAHRVMVVYNATTGEISFIKNNVDMGVAYTITPGTVLYPMTGGDSDSASSKCTLNAGASAFTNTVPVGANPGWYTP